MIQNKDNFWFVGQFENGSWGFQQKGCPPRYTSKYEAECIKEMYETLKYFSFMPDCGGDFCFLATEGMENECPEPEEGIHGDCKHKGYCRWANAFMIKRDKVLAKADGKVLK